jgi:hypothetical protein
VDWKQALIIIFAVICATLAKPNFTITIIPSIGLAILLNIKNYRKNQLGLFLFTFWITSVIVLVGQFIINYSGDRGDRLIIAPFQSVLTYVPNVFILVVFIIMSILFPILVTVLIGKKVRDNITFQLAWINFLLHWHLL